MFQVIYLLLHTQYSVSGRNIALQHTTHARDQPGREGLTTRLLSKKSWRLLRIPKGILSVSFSSLSSLAWAISNTWWWVRVVPGGRGSHEDLHGKGGSL